MINMPNDRFERLKQNLLMLNNKRNKKRVANARIHTTQYLAHVIPLATQRLLFAPIYRSCIAFQGGYNVLRKQPYPPNYTPLNILGDLYERVGFRRLWSLSRLHVLPGVIYPGVLMAGRSWSDSSTTSDSNFTLSGGYLHTAMLCSIAHLFSYPFDVAFVRFSSTMKTEASLWNYFRYTYMMHGIDRLYSGYSLCVASTAIHLLVALSVNKHLQSKLKEKISDQIDRSPIATSTIRPLEPRGKSALRCLHPSSELKPIEMFPWNVIFGSVAVFMARTVTYPLDTMRVRYQQETWNQSKKMSWRCLIDSMRVTFRGGMRRLYAGYPLRLALLAPECLVYGLAHFSVIQMLC